MTTTTRTQMGILFGFVAAFIVVIVSYGVAWKVYNKREERKEKARKEGLIERGFGAGEMEGEKGKGRGEMDRYRDGNAPAGNFGSGAGSGLNEEGN